MAAAWRCLREPICCASRCTEPQCTSHVAQYKLSFCCAIDGTSYSAAFPRHPHMCAEHHMVPEPAACSLAELPRSAASQIDPGAETRAGINRIRTAGLRRDFRSGAGRRAAACAKCVDIALCPCYDGLSRRAPARRCRAGGLHMSEPRLSVRDRCACTGEAAHAACAWFSPRLLRAGRCVARGRPGSSIGK